MATKIVHNCSTGEVMELPLSPGEEADLLLRQTTPPVELIITKSPEQIELEAIKSLLVDKGVVTQIEIDSAVATVTEEPMMLSANKKKSKKK